LFESGLKDVKTRGRYPASPP